MVRSILLLLELEPYIKYMSEEDIMLILFFSELPHPTSIALWEMMRAKEERERNAIFVKAYEWQESVKNRKKTAVR